MICIVGAGLTGATIAEHFVRHGKRVVVIDKRSHIAGNCYDELDHGIRVNRYGAHLFHTNDKEVWDYVQKFATWVPWYHRVVADVSGAFVPVPVNLETVACLGAELPPAGAEEQAPPTNSEEIAVREIGQDLFEKLVRGYTIKQWDKEPRELAPSVLARISVRKSFDDRYFTDTYQALPLNGYTAFVQEMLKGVEVRLNTAWEDVKGEGWEHVIFTGPIDGYFADAGLPPLEYRSIDFHWEVKEEAGYFQPNSVVNYPSPSTPFTRCVEYKHFLYQKSPWTILCKETTTSSGDPYYPVPTKANQELYEKYRSLAEGEKGVYFVGRLASYKYFNMDQAIRNAMDWFTCHAPTLCKSQS
jgi:UDP-galactopyranose mutase